MESCLGCRGDVPEPAAYCPHCGRSRLAHSARVAVRRPPTSAEVILTAVQTVLPAIEELQASSPLASSEKRANGSAQSRAEGSAEPPGPVSRLPPATSASSAEEERSERTASLAWLALVLSTVPGLNLSAIPVAILAKWHAEPGSLKARVALGAMVLGVAWVVVAAVLFVWQVG